MSIGILGRVLGEKIDFSEADLLRMRLRFNQFELEFASQDETLFAAVAEYYRPFIAADGKAAPDSSVYAFQLPGKSSTFNMRDFSRVERGKKIKEEFIDIFEGRVVRKKRSKVEMFFDGRNNVIFGSLHDNLHQVCHLINIVYSRYFLVNRGYMLWHAAAMGDPTTGKAAAIAGLGDTALNTIIMRLLEQDFCFCTYDRLMVRGGGDEVHALGYPKRPFCNAAAVLNNPRLAPIVPVEELAKLKAMPAREVLALDLTYDIPVEKIYGPDRYRLECELSSLYLIKWTADRNVQPRITRLEPGMAMKELALYYKDLGVFDLNNCRGERLVTPNWTHLHRTFDKIGIYMVDGFIAFDNLVKHVKSEGLQTGESEE